MCSWCQRAYYIFRTKGHNQRDLIKYKCVQCTHHHSFETFVYNKLKPNAFSFFDWVHSLSVIVIITIEYLQMCTILLGTSKIGCYNEIKSNKLIQSNWQKQTHNWNIQCCLFGPLK